MFWRKLIKILLIATLISLPAFADFSSDREAFYKKQAEKDLNIRHPHQIPDEESIEEEEYDAYTDEGQQTSIGATVNRTESRPVYNNANSLQVPMEQMEPPTNKKWGINLDMVSGYSSNVAQFEGAPSGSFYDVAPNAFYDGKLAPHFDVSIGADFFYRGYTDSEVDDLFRTTIFNVGGELTFWTSPNTFFGVGGKTTQFDGRTIDFTSPQNKGRDSILSINNFRLFWGKDWTRAFMELSVGQEYVRGKTTILDEVGNQFFPDMNQTFAGIRVGREFFQALRLEGQYTFKYNQYLDTRARLSTGQVDPNWFTANKLNEMEHSFLTSLMYRGVVLEGGYDYTLDRTSGAETRNTYHGHLFAPIPLGKRLEIKPEAGIRTTYYNQYIGQIFINPNATEKRNDQWTFYGAEASLDLGLIDPFFNYRRSELRSNFNIIQFEEDLFFGGLRMNF